MSRRGQVLLATRSAGKLRELLPMFTEAGITVLDLATAGIAEAPEEAALEAFDTFEANAFAKADHFHRLSGLAVVADDSGLEVAALAGAPGVRSKRWSGRDDLSGEALDAENNRRLIERLQGVADRRARYVCVAAFVDATSRMAARGIVDGELLTAPRGTGGFGYDPYFMPSEGDGRTFGEMTAGEKAGLSHRGRAVRALLRRLGAGADRD